jgi:hypothetical protein
MSFFPWTFWFIISDSLHFFHGYKLQSGVDTCSFPQPLCYYWQYISMWYRLNGKLCLYIILLTCFLNQLRKESKNKHFHWLIVVWLPLLVLVFFTNSNNFSDHLLSAWRILFSFFLPFLPSFLSFSPSFLPSFFWGAGVELKFLIQ